MKQPHLNIHLEKVTDENVDELLKLRIARTQWDFIASNQQSLVDAYLSLSEGKPVFPFGIYNGKTPVGFIMIDYRNDCERSCSLEEGLEDISRYPEWL